MLSLFLGSYLLQSQNAENLLVIKENKPVVDKYIDNYEAHMRLDTYNLTYEQPPTIFKVYLGLEERDFHNMALLILKHTTVTIFP